MPQIVENIKTLLGQKPMFGICMGHQILGQVETWTDGCIQLLHCKLRLLITAAVATGIRARITFAPSHCLLRQGCRAAQWSLAACTVCWRSPGGLICHRTQSAPHKLLLQVAGGTTFKLKFGHHGGNHPIRHDKDGSFLVPQNNTDETK